MPNFWYNFMVVESPKRLPKFVFLFLKKSIVISVILTTGTTLFFPLFSYANTNTVSEVISTKIAAVQDSYASAFASTKNSYASAFETIPTLSLPNPTAVLADSYASAFASTKNSYASALAVIDTTSFSISLPTLPTLSLPTVSVPALPTLALPAISVPTLPTLSLPNPTAVVADSYASAFASTKNSYASALAVIDTTSFSISLPTISIPTLPTLALPTISVPTPPTLSLPTLDLPNPTAVVADSYASAFASTKNSYASAFETIPTLALPTLSLPNPTAVVADSYASAFASTKNSYASAFASTKNSYASALAVIDTTSFSISLPAISVPTLPTLSLPTLSLPTLSLPNISVPTLPTLSLPNPTAVVADSYASAFASTKNSYASAFASTKNSYALAFSALENITKGMNVSVVAYTNAFTSVKNSFANLSHQSQSLASAAIGTSSKWDSLWCSVKGLFGFDCPAVTSNIAVTTPIVTPVKVAVETPIVVPQKTTVTKIATATPSSSVLSFNSIVSSLKNIFAPISSVTELKNRLALLENNGGAVTQTQFTALQNKVNTIASSNYFSP